MRNLVGWRAMDGPIEMAAVMTKLNHQRPTISDVPSPKKRILPDPVAQSNKPANVDPNTNNARILTVALPKCCDTGGEIQVRWSSNKAPTATAERATPAILKRFRVTGF